MIMAPKMFYKDDDATLFGGARGQTLEAPQAYWQVHCGQTSGNMEIQVAEPRADHDLLHLE